MNPPRRSHKLQHVLRLTAYIFLVLTPVAVVAYYMGQRSIVDAGLDYYEPRFEGAAASPTQLEELRCGPTIYVPAYSHVFWADGRGVLMSVTLSVRNTSAIDTVLLKSLDYYDTGGALLSQEIDQPVVLQPLQTATILVKESDVRGGVGANFLIRAGTAGNAASLAAEAMMVGRTASGPISLSLSGLVVAEECAP